MISVYVVLMDVISWLVYSACGWSFCRDVYMIFSLSLFFLILLFHYYINIKIIKLILILRSFNYLIIYLRFRFPSFYIFNLNSSFFV